MDFHHCDAGADDIEELCMTLLKMLLLFPFITLIALWQALVIFLLTYGLAWKMLRKFHKERYL